MNRFLILKYIKDDNMSYNIITKEDTVDVINEKLLSEEYAGLNEEQIHTRLVKEANYDTNKYVLKGNQLVRK